jgi:phosphoglycolate phosphatase-like HAD superfamily hydrolase
LKYKLGMFDLDGTLVDSRAVAYWACIAQFKAFGVSVPNSSEYFSRITGNYMEFYWQRGIPRSATKQELDAIFSDVYIKALDKIQLRIGVEKILAIHRERKLKTAIITGTSRQITDAINYQDKFGHTFDLVVAGTNKNIEIKNALKHFSVEPKRAFYVGDLAADIIAAKTCGVTAIAVMGGFGDQQALIDSEPNETINEISELSQFLK